MASQCTACGGTGYHRSDRGEIDRYCGTCRGSGWVCWCGAPAVPFKPLNNTDYHCAWSPWHGLDLTEADPDEA